MTEPIDVAKWMIEQFENNCLYQEDAAWEIGKKFGEPHIYENDNGNDAISKAVLKEFRKLTEGFVVWERGENAWRILSEKEKVNYTGRQED
ncbi:MAG: hypothetical protein PHN75_20880 [Syntrophales bacterium]|nr:hypothetical protein [Syntrophales bacterium]